jgi:hypothetical protein
LGGRFKTNFSYQGGQAQQFQIHKMGCRPNCLARSFLDEFDFGAANDFQQNSTCRKTWNAKTKPA